MVIQWICKEQYYEIKLKDVWEETYRWTFGIGKEAWSSLHCTLEWTFYIQDDLANCYQPLPLTMTVMILWACEWHNYSDRNGICVYAQEYVLCLTNCCFWRFILSVAEINGEYSIWYYPPRRPIIHLVPTGFHGTFLSWKKQNLSWPRFKHLGSPL